MSPSPRNPSGPDFWKCGNCGTPNPSAGYLTRCVACGTPIRAPGRIVEPGSGAAERLTSKRSTRFARFLAGMVGLYGLVILADYCVLQGGVGPEWLRVGLLFFPRIVWLIPGFMLAAGLLLVGARKTLLADLFLCGLVAGPLLGFNVPWGNIAPSTPDGPRLRVMTLNRGQGRLESAELIRQIESERIDLVSFQEGKPDPSLDAYFADGWYRDRGGYVASRFPVLEEYPNLPEESMDQGRYIGRLTRVRIRLPRGTEVVFASVHLPTLRPGLDRLMRGDSTGLDLLVPWWEKQLGVVVAHLEALAPLPFILGGDLNMPSDYPGLATLRARYPFAYESAGWGYGYTRPAAFPFLRIDHIVSSRDWWVSRCWVARSVGSDHRPLIAELILTANARP